MASSPEADFQRCPLCHERCTPSRCLQALSCLHAVCCQCLEAQRPPAAAFELRCPICQRKATLSEPWGMDALPSSSFLLGNLQDVVGPATEEQNHSSRGPTPLPRQQRHRWSSSGSSPAAASAAAPDRASYCMRHGDEVSSDGALGNSGLPLPSRAPRPPPAPPLSGSCLRTPPQLGSSVRRPPARPSPRWVPLQGAGFPPPAPGQGSPQPVVPLPSPLP
ncbi:hypothetical protein KIL84_008430 [Mauremys mutica]|uniref:RING-type domain-containing protein n=1 Tax=Mauremys mutica TaxID=74926 RepID=A0A9D3X9P7_9SAUR|nr:hypothetical protein KIL84_008430 [Mauremys mutica]